MKKSSPPFHLQPIFSKPTVRAILCLSEEEAHDFASHVLASSFLMVHDAIGGGPADSVTSSQQFGLKHPALFNLMPEFAPLIQNKQWTNWYWPFMCSFCWELDSI